MVAHDDTSRQATADRPPAWVFGAPGGIQVWAVDGPTRLMASLLIEAEGRILLLNRMIVGSPLEHQILNWGLARVAAGSIGFFVYTIAG